jgi:hypothetical protein
MCCVQTLWCTYNFYSVAVHLSKCGKTWAVDSMDSFRDLVFDIATTR